jgi:FMN phosphatase YigB (HAD superfamily)
LRVGGVTDPSRALMIGDNAHADIGGAAACGIDTCWYNPSGAACAGVTPTLTAPTHAAIAAWLDL